MTSVQFVLLREGPSDDGLVNVLSRLLLGLGADSVTGTPRSYRGSAEEKLTRLLEEDVRPDVVFFFRDTDSTTYEHRYREIMQPARTLGVGDACVPVIAVQELEAWLLLDEIAIRQVAGKPSGRLNLGLPSVHAVESVRAPKELLREVLLVASEKSGRRLERERKKFSINRASLLERLDHEGPVTSLSAWQRLEREVSRALGEMDR